MVQHFDLLDAVQVLLRAAHGADCNGARGALLGAGGESCEVLVIALVILSAFAVAPGMLQHGILDLGGLLETANRAGLHDLLVGGAGRVDGLAGVGVLRKDVGLPVFHIAVLASVVAENALLAGLAIRCLDFLGHGHILILMALRLNRNDDRLAAILALVDALACLRAGRSLIVGLDFISIRVGMLAFLFRSAVRRRRQSFFVITGLRGFGFDHFGLFGHDDDLFLSEDANARAQQCQSHQQCNKFLHHGSILLLIKIGSSSSIGREGSCSGVCSPMSTPTGKHHGVPLLPSAPASPVELDAAENGAIPSV